MSAHTPGPWAVTKRMRASYSAVGIIPIEAHVDGCGSETVVAVYANRENAEANARLIAAAPDLLEALQALTDANVNEAWRYPTVWEPIVTQARATINKAKGLS